MDDFARRLILATQQGLPLTPEPYAELARTLGCDEATVLAGIEDLLASRDRAHRACAGNAESGIRGHTGGTQYRADAADPINQPFQRG